MIASVACGLLALACTLAAAVDACTRGDAHGLADLTASIVRRQAEFTHRDAHIYAAARCYETMMRRRLLAPVGFPAADPGNPGALLWLVSDPHGAITQRGGLLLLARNPADGRTVALPVPPDVTDPVAAAAWTYGVSRDTYLDLARRT